MTSIGSPGVLGARVPRHDVTAAEAASRPALTSAARCPDKTAKLAWPLGGTMTAPRNCWCTIRRTGVGVVVVEGLKAGTDMLCVVTADNSQFHLDSQDGGAYRPQDCTCRHQSGATRCGNTAMTSARRSPISPRASTSTSTISRPNGGEGHGPSERQIQWESFSGWRRENGRVGVRNHVVILPLDDLSNAACESVANNIKGTLAIPHAYGRLQFGEDLEVFFRTLIGTGAYPNVAAVVVIGIEDGWTKSRRRRHQEDRQTRGEASASKGTGDIMTVAKASRSREGFSCTWASERPREECADVGPVGLHQMRRERHHHGPRLQPDGR